METSSTLAVCAPEFTARSGKQRAFLKLFALLSVRFLRRDRFRRETDMWFFLPSTTTKLSFPSAPLPHLHSACLKYQVYSDFFLEEPFY